MECNYKFQFDEVQGHLRAQRRPSCERQHHLRGTGHRPARVIFDIFTRYDLFYHCKKTESIVYKADRRYC